MSEYRHGLNADMRFQAALATAEKTGSAFTGWRPKEPKRRSSWWLVAFAAALVIAARVSGL